ncbi:hypothetical protein OIDMADRAFT_105726 [Oidiodendron maius Zn]|uniref:N-alpha-acetyltransferase 40 n=1 Tax=Oidiodendron maius (strain Zn) TaxID=913774 RepID=A0A0C3H4T6_OIDMZ|nr:hypothetical protein OIDMADRAFT_105726 [Oidiodendron maius Zn]
MEKDGIEAANEKGLEAFMEEYLPPREQWGSWTHPKTGDQYEVALSAASGLSDADFEACFQLIELTSAEDYKQSKAGWKPSAKRREMKLLDLKYFLVKRGSQTEGFVSFMPTHEDGYPVIYCYEIHLATTLRGTGLAGALMRLLESVGRRIPETTKMMLTCFTGNQRAAQFYAKLGYSEDEFSPKPRVLRNGTRVESEYVILSKSLS